MVKQIAVLRTHLIEKFIIQEYQKMKGNNIEVFLQIDNQNHIIKEHNSGLFDLIFFNTTCKCILTNKDTLKKINLPLIADYDYTEDIGKILWYNGDYIAYIVNKLLPDYEYYWFFDYDCFYNGKNYNNFFDYYEHIHSDFICSVIQPASKSWSWQANSDWIYKNEQKMQSFFPVFRLSKRAILHLFKQRLKHQQIFNDSNYPYKRWINCELFVPTELRLNNMSMTKIEDHRLRFKPSYDLSRDRIFLTEDELLYHPVKGNFNQLINTKEIIINNLYEENNSLKKSILKNIVFEYINSTNHIYNLNFSKTRPFFCILSFPNKSWHVHYEIIIRDGKIDLCLHLEKDFAKKYKHLFRKLLIPHYKNLICIKRNFICGLEAFFSCDITENHGIIIEIMKHLTKSSHSLIKSLQF